MTHRYCPKCEEWRETADCKTSVTGEIICSEHGTAVHGSIPPTGPHIKYSIREFRRDHSYFKDYSNELDAAIRQELVEP